MVGGWVGGWIESRVYRVTDRNNFKILNFILCNLFSGRSLVREGSCIWMFFSFIRKGLLVLISGDVGVGCKIVTESFVDFFRVLAFDFAVVIKVRWRW